MSQQTHPHLRAFTTYAESELRDEDDKTLAVLQDRPAADARRLAACWNACQGLSTEELEDIATTGGMLGPRDDVARIAEQRDALLVALEPFAAFLDALEHMGGTYPKTGVVYAVTSHIGGHREMTVADFKNARAAIATAKGEPT